MVSRKLRFAIALLPLVLLISLIGFLAPGASALGTISVEFVDGHQPADAIKGQMITAVPFDPTPSDGETPGPFVEVQVTEDTGEGIVPVVGADVTFRLATNGDSETDEPVASGTLTVASEVTDADGIATFDTSLSIAQPNEATFTGYELVPQATTPEETSGPFIGAVAFASILTEGPVSSPFDIWDAGCNGGGSGCSINLRGGNDAYSVSGDISLSASDLTGSGLTLNCPGQTLIFSSHIFSHATLGENGSVFLLSHITRQEMKTASNNGQAHVNWCVGLTSNVKWLHNGARFSLQDTNGTAPGGSLFVGMAPKCPKKNAASFAPCIVSQMSDGVGGNFTRGWLPGGDPPRRT
jgi:hypothetical protein